VGSRLALKIAKDGALDLQSQVIKLTSCLPMVDESPASSTTKTGRHDIAEILQKVALKHQKSKSYI
jgi:hypothetical protein